MPQNYEVLASGFGAYKRGSVVPEWVAARAGDVAALVRRAVLRPTDKPVNVDVRVPEPKVATDPTPAMAEELSRLQAENARLAADNRTVHEVAASLRQQLAARDKALGEQTAAIAHLEEAAEAHQKARDAAEAEIAALRADLEAATAPSKPAKKTAAA